MGTVLAEGGGVWAKNPPRPEKKTLEKIVRFLSAAGKILTVYAPMRADTLVLHV